MQITSILPNVTTTIALTDKLQLEVDSVIKSMQTWYPSEEWSKYSLDDVLQSMMYIDIRTFKETWESIHIEWCVAFSQHFLGLLMGNRMFELSNLLELDFVDVVTLRVVPRHVVITACLEMNTEDHLQRNEELVKFTTTTYYKGGAYNCLINGEETYIGETDYLGAYGITLLTPEAKFETALEYLASINPRNFNHYYLRNGKWESLYMSERLDTLNDIDIFVHRSRFNVMSK